MTDLPKKIRARGIYLLPNLFTTSVIFAGFYSVVAAMKGDFEIAAVAIFVAFICDGLDGRVARLTNTQTDFGAQYDSLSDMVAFGLAPALIIYTWSLSQLGKLGWIVAFLYAAATALRLARFNTQLQDADKRFFQGLPSPAAAAVVSAMVWLGGFYDVTGILVAIPAAAITIFVAGLMVSNVRYLSFKKLDFKGRVPFFAIIIFVLLLTAIALEPPQMLFGIFLIYALSGPVMTLSQLRRIRKRQRRSR